MQTLLIDKDGTISIPKKYRTSNKIVYTSAWQKRIFNGTSVSLMQRLKEHNEKSYIKEGYFSIKPFGKPVIMYKLKEI